MDLCDHAYETKMRLWANSTELTPVRWFRACDDAPFFPHSHTFTSTITWGKFDDLPQVGEQLRAKETTYDQGQNFYNYEGPNIIGSLSAALGGGIVGVDEPVPLLDTGVPVASKAKAADGHVLATWQPHREGWLLAIGSPSVVRWTTDGRTIDETQNADFWAALKSYASAEQGPNQIGCAGPVSHWSRDDFAPDLGDLGTDGKDYSVGANVQRFLHKLEECSVYLMGWNFYGMTATPDFPDRRLLPRLGTWCRAGGILIVFGAPGIWYNPNVFDPNTYMSELPTPIRFGRKAYGSPAAGKAVLSPSRVEQLSSLTVSWTNIGFSVAQDGQYALAGPGGLLGYGAPTLKVYFPRFNLPTNAVVVGIEVMIRRQANQLVQTLGGACYFLGRTKSMNAIWPTGAWQDFVLGGPTDLWGGPALSADQFATMETLVEITKAIAGGDDEYWVDYVELRLYWGDTSQLAPTTLSACYNRCHPLVTAKEPYLPLKALEWASGCSVAEGNPLFTDCLKPDPNPAIGPVVMATEYVGEGAVVAIGTPALLRAQSPEGAVEIGWDALLWDLVSAWLADVGRAQPYAAAHHADHWLQVGAGPALSDLGWEGFDYSSDSALEALKVALDDVAVLYYGWTNYDFAGDRQLVNPQVHDVIRRWVRDGGILVAVDNTERWDDAGAPLPNALLEAVGSNLRFIHFDVGPTPLETFVGVCGGNYPFFDFGWPVIFVPPALVEPWSTTFTSPGALPFTDYTLNTFNFSGLPPTGGTVYRVRFKAGWSAGPPVTQIRITVYKYLTWSSANVDVVPPSAAYQQYDLGGLDDDVFAPSASGADHVAIRFLCGNHDGSVITVGDVELIAYTPAHKPHYVRFNPVHAITESVNMQPEPCGVRYLRSAEVIGYPDDVRNGGWVLQDAGDGEIEPW